MKILVVEDDAKIASFVGKGLKEQGFSVDLCDNGDDGLERAREQTYDVVLLDIMLPGRDGLSVVKQLRQGGHSVPVILLTARTALDERVEGLNAGADDYLTKPFFTEELVARIHAVTRRASGDELSVLHNGDLTVNLIARTVERNGTSIELTPREFNLLELLMRAPGRVYSRTQIIEYVWGYDFDPQTNLVDVYIRRVRKKIMEAGEGDMIETVRGVGYKMRKYEACSAS